MHAGAIRAFLYNNAQLETPYNVTVAEVTAAISELRNSVGGVTTSAPLSQPCFMGLLDQLLHVAGCTSPLCTTAHCNSSEH